MPSAIRRKGLSAPARHFRRVRDQTQLTGERWNSEGASYPLAGLKCLSEKREKEIVRVGRDLLKQTPASFDGREVLLALIFSAPLFHQAVLAPDAFQGAMADRQVELADQAAGAESGQGLTERDDLAFEVSRSAAGLLVGRPRLLQESGGSLLLVATEPLADGGHGGGYKRFSSHAPGRNSEWRPCAEFTRAPPGSPPSRAANSHCLFSLKHFRFARGIRSE